MLRRGLSSGMKCEWRMAVSRRQRFCEALRFTQARRGWQNGLQRACRDARAVRDIHGYVYGASYRWRADQSGADLVEVGKNAAVDVAAGMKGRPQKTQNWFLPGC